MCVQSFTQPKADKHRQTLDLPGSWPSKPSTRSTMTFGLLHHQPSLSFLVSLQRPRSFLLGTKSNWCLYTTAASALPVSSAEAANVILYSSLLLDLSTSQISLPNLAFGVALQYFSKQELMELLAGSLLKVLSCMVPKNKHYGHHYHRMNVRPSPRLMWTLELHGVFLVQSMVGLDPTRTSWCVLEELDCTVVCNEY